MPRATDWEWSSAHARLGGEDPNQLVDSADLNPSRTAWNQVLEEEWKAAEFEMRLREATRVGPPLGDQALLDAVEEQAGRPCGSSTKQKALFAQITLQDVQAAN